MQIITIFKISIKSLKKRIGTSAITIVGVAGVAFVFISMFSIGEGYSKVMASTGSGDNYIILKKGAQNEIVSSMGDEEFPYIVASGFVKRDYKLTYASKELLWHVRLKDEFSIKQHDIALRGITKTGKVLRNTFKITDGRDFTEGLNEIIVGAQIARRFPELAIGSEIRFINTNWKVVGIFGAGNGAAESEIWVDLPMLQSALPWGDYYNSIRVQLADEDSLPEFNNELMENPLISSEAQKLTNYYDGLAKSMKNWMFYLGTPVIFVMALGAILANVNTMYSSVTSRTREIATLRALGFKGAPLAISVYLESILLSLLGSILATVIAYIFIDGATGMSGTGDGLSLNFQFELKASHVFLGSFCSLLIGGFGAIYPAYRAARLRPAIALKQL